MKYTNGLMVLAALLFRLGIATAQVPPPSLPAPTETAGPVMGPPVAAPPTEAPPLNTPSLMPQPSQGTAPNQTYSGPVSSWLAYPRGPGCCEPAGKDGP